DDPADPAAAPWVGAKRRAVAGPVETSAEKLDRFRAIRRCNEALQGFVADRRARLVDERDRLAREGGRIGVTGSREVAVGLPSQRRLREALGAALPGVWAEDGLALSIASGV